MLMNSVDIEKICKAEGVVFNEKFVFSIPNGDSFLNDKKHSNGKYISSKNGNLKISNKINGKVSAVDYEGLINSQERESKQHDNQKKSCDFLIFKQDSDDFIVFCELKDCKIEYKVGMVSQAEEQLISSLSRVVNCIEKISDCCVVGVIGIRQRLSDNSIVKQNYDKFTNFDRKIVRRLKDKGFKMAFVTDHIKLSESAPNVRLPEK